MDRRFFARGRGFTLIETMTAIALLTIALGLMVSLSRHVRAASADELTKEILHRLDAAMAVYVHQNGTIPVVAPFIAFRCVLRRGPRSRCLGKSDCLHVADASGDWDEPEGLVFFQRGAGSAVSDAG
jgi:prepilin-type N-terminal cleavage/methylation domain-containing protein